ncbi:hypothetical protein SAMN05878437_2257 [Vreelandella subglaciescola]|uniref:Uncharacterized protein n=1 Tax=Vreelandella subglaciescola TaxID=29571 RepID=A0A1M7HPB1_9GAMM|nr:hypothetical protein SAMN05878437_2257 [Halomonas subglaciescola]
MILTLPPLESVGKKRIKLGSRFQTFSKKLNDRSRFIFDESLALIIGDLSPTQASAHMNYLINLLKSVSRGES